MVSSSMWPCGPAHEQTHEPLSPPLALPGPLGWLGARELGGWPNPPFEIPTPNRRPGGAAAADRHCSCVCNATRGPSAVPRPIHVSSMAPTTRHDRRNRPNSAAGLRRGHRLMPMTETDQGERMWSCERNWRMASPRASRHADLTPVHETGRPEHEMGQDKELSISDVPTDTGLQPARTRGPSSLSCRLRGTPARPAVVKARHEHRSWPRHRKSLSVVVVLCMPA